MYHVLWLTSLHSSLYRMGRPSGMDFIGRGEDERLHGRFLSAYLSVEEMRAVLNAPNLHHCDGIRDRAMLHLCFAAGLRVSELAGLPLHALEF
jgi:integrase/recombinase XerD